jgi:hypothetical protein
MVYIVRLQIMDPRMDTGMAEPPPPFDPHTPLLSSEVCWILDRSFACEVRAPSLLRLVLPKLTA